MCDYLCASLDKMILYKYVPEREAQRSTAMSFNTANPEIKAFAAADFNRLCKKDRLPPHSPPCPAPLKKCNDFNWKQ